MTKNRQFFANIFANGKKTFLRIPLKAHHVRPTPRLKCSSRTRGQILNANEKTHTKVLKRGAPL